MKVNIIGAGLAGSECAIYLANHGVKVNLFDIKPNKFNEAQKNKNLAELVCSNSLKSNDIYGNACGLLKEEMRLLNSTVIKVADETKVPAGNALAVNREEFASKITDLIFNNKNINFISQEVEKIEEDAITVIATGPLTVGKLNSTITSLVGDGLHFYDASAPIISKESIDMENAFVGDRYNKGNGDHINCPMTKEEYQTFVKELLGAERATLHDFEKADIFEGCMPVEVMASRGENTLRFGPLKPAGLDNPKTGRWAYATLQLRREDKEGKMYNLVGFQTNLTFSEQKRVFSLIPALKNAEFYRYGVMHRNTFINSPKCLNIDNTLKENQNIYFAGQITGVEGYVESTASGLITAIYILKRLLNQQIEPISSDTVIGSLQKYITTENKDFEPMNANFGILNPIWEIIDKKEKKKMMAERSLKTIEIYKKENEL